MQNPNGLILLQEDPPVQEYTFNVKNVGDEPDAKGKKMSIKSVDLNSAAVIAPISASYRLQVPENSLIISDLQEV
jgi:hypothetical protein